MPTVIQRRSAFGEVTRRHLYVHTRCRPYLSNVQQNWKVDATITTGSRRNRTGAGHASKVDLGGTLRECNVHIYIASLRNYLETKPPSTSTKTNFADTTTQGNLYGTGTMVVGITKQQKQELHPLFVSFAVPTADWPNKCGLFLLHV